MDIIPAIDLMNGQCVRLRQGDYDNQTVYSASPLETARQFEQSGIRRLHLVDLEGARAGQPHHLGILKMIRRHTALQVDFGGGLRTREHATAALEAGAAQITAGSIAVKQPEEVRDWAHAFGPERIIIGADVREGHVAVSGWREQTSVALWPFLEQWHQQGFRNLICTDIARDGMLSGPAITLYREIIRRFPQWRVIASGGVSKVDDLHRLRDAGCAGVIIGKALYEQRITLKELEPFLC
ncbi:MAG: 1-(5-phosphoribosyl)-5-[(5-phosphoribosylamino)methylideneamino]imidazole-4-carboxamide isomerase [Calditrichaeota bacterium]|nr:MAG: 1-(5-phosphoribosyl)-5-[(5-phosphoribosylamino)methylideneamino]imidazole-4-carboxamide isomerase [Calditrichota bacterium]